MKYLLTKNQILVILLSFFFIIITLYFISTGMRQYGKTLVHISVFPSDSKIEIDGKAARTGDNYLEPGIHTIQATREGFSGASSNIAIEQKERTVAITLIAATEEAKKYIQDHQDEYKKVFGAGQREAAEIGKTFNDHNPIAKDLPYKTFFYSVGYRMDQSDPSGNSIIIEIDAPEGYKQSAIYRIRQLGYDPTDFNITFRNYENPFPL